MGSAISNTRLQVHWYFHVKILNLCHVIMSPPMDIARGGYVLQDGGATPDYAIIATGSEVELATNVADKLRAQGKKFV